MAEETRRPARAIPRRGATGQPAASGGSQGDYIVLNGQQVALKKHETDFSVMASADTPEPVALKTAPLSHSTRSGCQNIKLAIASYDGVPCRNGNTDSLTLRHLGTYTPRSTGLYSGS